MKRLYVMAGLLLSTALQCFKDNFGKFPCAPHLRRETGKDQYRFQVLLCQMNVSTFS